MITFLNKITEWIDRIGLFFFHLAAWLCLALALLTFEQVIARYFFNEPSIALQELEWHLFGLIFLFGGAMTLKKNGHVRVDLIYAHLKPRGKAIIDLIGYLIFFFPLCWLIIETGSQFSLKAREYSTGFELYEEDSSEVIRKQSWIQKAKASILKGEVSGDPDGLPARWLIKGAIPFGFLLLFIQGCSEILKILLTLITGKLSKDLQKSATH